MSWRCFPGHGHYTERNGLRVVISAYRCFHTVVRASTTLPALKHRAALSDEGAWATSIISIWLLIETCCLILRIKAFSTGKLSCWPCWQKEPKFLAAITPLRSRRYEVAVKSHTSRSSLAQTLFAMGGVVGSQPLHVRLTSAPLTKSASRDFFQVDEQRKLITPKGSAVCGSLCGRA
jgi:hypothetical protein